MFHTLRSGYDLKTERELPVSYQVRTSSLNGEPTNKKAAI